jgi:hypothetical protein
MVVAALQVLQPKGLQHGCMHGIINSSDLLLLMGWSFD